MALFDPDKIIRDQAGLAVGLQDFIKRYAPLDEDERRRFEQDTYFLFQRAQSVAVDPLIEKMSAAMMLAPNHITILSNPATAKKD